MDQSKLKYIAIALIVLSLAGVVALVVTRRGDEPRIVRYTESGETGRGRVSERPGDGTAISISLGDESLSGGEATADEESADPEGSEGAGTRDGQPGDTASGAASADSAAAGNAASGSATGIAGAPGSSGAESGGLPGTDGQPGADGQGASSAIAEGGEVDGSVDGEAGDAEEEEEAAEGKVIVAGNVLRGENPLPGAELVLTSNTASTNQRAQTDEQGRYHFPPVEEGDYTLFLAEPNSPGGRRRMQLVADQHRTSEDFVVPDLPPVKGEVSSAASGESIGGAEVQVWQGNSLIGSVSSRSEGQFELFPLEAGNYTLKGSANGYLPGEKSFEVSANTQAQDYVYLELPESAVVSGRVIGPGGNPVGSARVSLFGSAVYNDPFSQLGVEMTDGSGRFRFALPDSGYTGEFRAGAYKEGMLPGYSQVFLKDQLTDEEIVVQLREGGGISGRVVDGEETPIPGAEVTLEEGFPSTGAILQRFNIQPPKATTGGQGLFTIEGLEPGQNTFAVAADGYVSANPSFNISQGSITQAGDVVLESEEAGAREGRVFGLIVDERGDPLVNHNVYIRGSGGEYSTRTDSRGGFLMDDVEQGEYVLYTNGSLLRGEDFIVVDQTYPFARPGDERIYLIYDLAQSIRFRLLNSRGEPVNNFRAGIRVRDQGAVGFNGVRETFGLGYDKQVQTSNGEAVLGNLIAGTATLTISLEGQGSVEEAGITIPVGQQVDLGDIYIEGGAALEGQVVSSANGHAVSGVLVRALAPPGAPHDHPLNVLRFETTTETSGEFYLGGLPQGTVGLELSKNGWATEQITGIQITGGQGNQAGQIELDPAAALRGSVVNSQGAALSDVQVKVKDQDAFTDREGRFYMDSLPAGPATAEAQDRSGQYSSATMDVNLLAGEAATANFVLEPKS